MVRSNKETFAKWSEKLYDDLVKAGVDMDDDRIFLLVRSSVAAFLKDNMKSMAERLQHDVQKQKDAIARSLHP